MSYHIYTTDGIVLKRTSFGEANVFLHILTKDLGLIMASARSVRLDSSKLRSALQEYSFVAVSCIKGKNGWKITNAKELGNFFFEGQRYSGKTLAQIVVVLLKMIQGESIHSELFDTVKTGFDFLRNLSEKNVKDFEVLILLRIMYQLGYVAGDSGKELITPPIIWTEDLLQKVEKDRVRLVQVINKALEESQL